MDHIIAFKNFIQRAIDAKIGPGKEFPAVDDAAKAAHVSRRNFTNFKVKAGQEPHAGVLGKMAAALGYEEGYFTYIWDYYTQKEHTHPDEKFPQYAQPDELTLLAGDNEPLFDRLLLLVEQNPDYFDWDEKDLHLERVVTKLEELLAAEGQSNFM